MPEDHENPEHAETERVERDNPEPARADQDADAEAPTKRVRHVSGDLSGSNEHADSSTAADETRSGEEHTAEQAEQDVASSDDVDADVVSSDDADVADSEERTRPEMSVPPANSPADTSDTETTQWIPVVPDVAPESDTERTETIPAVTEVFTPPAQTAAFTPATAHDYSGVVGSFDGPGGPPPGRFDQAPFGFSQQPPEQEAPGGDKRSRRRRTLLRSGVGAGIAFALLLLLYIGDLAFSSGQVPRGTVVADVAIGGLDRAAAERKLRAELGPRLSEPVRLRVGKAQASIDPQQAGLSIDWEATLDKAGSQPLNPITRLTSFFTTREINPVSNVDQAKLTAALQEVKPELHREPVEGTIRFEGTDPVAVMPVTGRSLNIEQAEEVVVDNWADPRPVQLPYKTQSVSTTPKGVRTALHNIAEPAVSAPVTVQGDGVKATLTPEEIASALRFTPDGKGGLKWRVDIPTATDAVKPELKSTLQKGKNADIVIKGGKPVVKPSKTGRGIDWKKTFAPLGKAFTAPGPDSLQAVYKDKPAEFTTEEAKALGIREVVSEFKTSGFSHDSGVNIRLVAEEVDGAIVKPGETFSLNGYTGIRQKPQGYIASGIIKNGRPAEAVGGGISQFATTLFNAAYFAGMKDVAHREHSYYISRYPLGREATVFQRKDGTSVIDVKFKNVSDSGILIDTKWTPQSIKVTFWGTEQFKVDTKVSEKSNFTEPDKIVVPAGEPCVPTSGQRGFTVYNTRIRTNIETGEVTKTRDKTVYEPQPIVECAKKKKKSSDKPE